MPDRFLPRPECLLQTIQVVRFQLSLRKCLPDVGIGRSDGENVAGSIRSSQACPQRLRLL